MLRNRKDYPSVITPKGVVAWASIDQPDFEYKDEGEFHIRVRFEPDALADIEVQARELLEEAFAAKTEELKREKKGAILRKLHMKEDIFPEELTRDEAAEPTGFVLIRAGMKHRIEIKNGPRAGQTFEKFPDVFDAKGKRLKKRPKIGSGSEVKISIRLMEYFIAKDGEMGIKFELEAVQIIKLVQGGSRDAASYGFGEEEGDSLADDSPFDETDGFEGDDDDDADTDRDF